MNSRPTTIQASKAVAGPDDCEVVDFPGSLDWSRRLSARDFWRAAATSDSKIQQVTWNRFFTLNARTIPIIAAVLDFIILTAITFEAGAVYHYLAFDVLPSPTFYFSANVGMVALFVVQCGLARDYSTKSLRNAKEQLRLVFGRWNVAFSVFVVVLFMIQATDFYSRGAIVLQYAVGIAAAVSLRLLLSRFVEGGLQRGIIRGRGVIMIGRKEILNDVQASLKRDSAGTDVVDVIALDPNDARSKRVALQRVKAIAWHMPVEDIVIALPWQDHAHIREFVEGLSTIPATVHLAPDQSWVWIRDLVVNRVGRVHTLRLARAPLTLKDRCLKRAFDIAMAGTLLVLAAPVLLLIAVCIKLDSDGPVLFRQRRNGFNQREFRVFKFRTMTTMDDGDVIRQAERNDSRVTSVGRLLRRTNLDEVPQLLNVLAGDMSLVGPRPHAVAHDNEYEERIRLYASRHKVKPGITGWAQVNGLRGETDTVDKMIRRVEHDLFYIDHWSVMFDIKIMLTTIFSPRSYRNAY